MSALPLSPKAGEIGEALPVWHNTEVKPLKKRHVVQRPVASISGTTTAVAQHPVPLQRPSKSEGETPHIAAEVPKTSNVQKKAPLEQKTGAVIKKTAASLSPLAAEKTAVLQKKTTSAASPLTAEKIAEPPKEQTAEQTAPATAIPVRSSRYARTASVPPMTLKRFLISFSPTIITALVLLFMYFNPEYSLIPMGRKTTTAPLRRPPPTAAPIPPAPTPVPTPATKLPAPTPAPTTVAPKNLPRASTLILIMLVKNEEVHLRRTLPKWAKVADFWVAGIDHKNTDSSKELFEKHLGHIPGVAVTVVFDGMGPSLTQLVEVGFERFPHATHGMLADADFEPKVETFDKRQLDQLCSFHSFTIWTYDSLSPTSRYMDWIYRNIKGAKVVRRTHQALDVPRLPPTPNHKCDNLIGFEVTEQQGGYQDRSGNKSLTYINLLERDLVDMPGDERTIYYLGHAHLDRWTEKNEERDHLVKAQMYFGQRADMTSGFYEQRYLATLKLGEICARYTGNITCVKEFWGRATQSDVARGDAWFYLGQHLRLTGKPEEALPYLAHAAQLRVPFRTQALWYAIYDCLAGKEFVLAAFEANASAPWVDHLVKEVWDKIEKNCGSNFESERSRVRDWAKAAIKRLKKQAKKFRKEIEEHNADKEL